MAASYQMRSFFCANERLHMHDLNNYILILSSDFLYLTIFMSLSYTLGGLTNIRGIRYPDFNSLSVGIPWFMTIFVFFVTNSC